MKSTRRGSFSEHRSEKTPGSKYSSTSGLSPRGHLERQAEFHASTQDEALLSCPQSAGTRRSDSEIRGTLRFLPPLELRPSSNAPNPVESREVPPPPPVSLTSQSHHEKPPEVTCTSRGKPGFPASTRERPRETFFNTSRGQVPLPGLESNDALPLATHMETRLPWRPTRGSLTSPSHLVRNRTLGPPLENHPETPPSSRR